MDVRQLPLSPQIAFGHGVYYSNRNHKEDDVDGYIHAHSVCMEVKGQWGESVTSFHRVGPVGHTWVIKLGDRCFNSLSHLTSPSSDGSQSSTNTQLHIMSITRERGREGRSKRRPPFPNPALPYHSELFCVTLFLWAAWSFSSVHTL